MTTNLGPVGMPGGDLTNPLRYNPRCLMRDMNPFIGQHYTSFNWSTWTIEESRDIDEFQSRLAGAPGNEDQKDFPLNFFGVHGGGHTFLGGMTGQRMCSTLPPHIFRCSRETNIVILQTQTFILALKNQRFSCITAKLTASGRSGSG